jgi:hypothetical protein
MTELSIEYTEYTFTTAQQISIVMIFFLFYTKYSIGQSIQIEFQY